MHSQGSDLALNIQLKYVKTKCTAVHKEYLPFFAHQVVNRLQRLPLTHAFEGFFSVCLNLSFRGRQSTVSMVFHAL